MTSPVVAQLILCKRLFSVGEHHAEQADPVSAGLAISLFQDAAELFLWSLIKHLGSDVKKNADFSTLLEGVRQAGNREGKDSVAFKAQMMELNNARVNFKHYGNLPDPSEAKKFQLYTHEFLCQNTKKYLDQDFNGISLSSLIRFPEVKSLIDAAENCLAEGRYFEGLAEVGKGAQILVEMLNHYAPHLDSEFTGADLLVQKAGDRHFRGFSKLERYLHSAAQVNVAALFGVPIKSYLDFVKSLPAVTRFAAGNFRVRRLISAEPTHGEVRKSIDFLVVLAIKAERLV